MANVLVIRFSAFGDVAMLVPVIHSIAKKYPDDHFFVLTKTKFEILFRSELNNLSTIGANYEEYRNLFSIFRLFKFLGKYHIDYVADVHSVIRSHFLCFLYKITGKKVRRIDKERHEKKKIIKHTAPLKPLKANIERYQDVFKSLGFFARTDYNNYFDYNKTGIHLPDNLLLGKENNLIGIAPFAMHTSKIYPMEKMEEVVKNLSEMAHIFIFGSKDEKKVSEEWENKYENVTSLAGKLDLEQELLLISKLNVMISMDSANMHLASLTATPVISIWGGTHPYLGFYGYRQSPDNIVQLGLPCRPCSVFGSDRCSLRDRPFACMRDIDPDKIVEKAKKFLL